MTATRIPLLMLAIVTMSVTTVSACGSPAGTSSASAPSVTSAPSPTSARPGVTSLLPRPPTLPARVICRIPNLKISLVHTGAAAGTVTGDLLFTNQSDVPCKLAGWPTVIGVDSTQSAAAKHLLTTEFGPTGIRIPPVVTLNQGAAAAAVLVGSDVYGSCSNGHPQTYRQLRVTPPGNSGSVSLSAWFPFLGRYLPKCGPLSVTPVVPEASVTGA
jgi:hypothetical protein